jgi:peptidoglycan/LPS O-acetylase OafA/YrhL
MSDASPELSRRRNNLDAIRLGGALMVVLGHSYVLSGKPVAPPVIFDVPIHTLGVFVFFIISGYLITKSWLRRPQWKSYLAARSLRIFPALIVAVLMSVFVLGPVFTVIDLRAYFTDPNTWLYLRNLYLQPVFGLSGVFTTVPYPNVVNGSLWTLPIEFSCYLFVPVMMLAPRRARVPVVVVFGLACVAAVLFATPAQNVFGFYLLVTAAEPWVFFAGGMLCALLLERHLFRLDAALLGLFALTVVEAVRPSLGHVMMWVVLPYAVLALGLASSPIIRRASRFGDFSYGMYIYAFPVQQMVFATIGVRSLTVNLVIVVAATAVLSVASWHLVEAPALKLKTRFESTVPARGRRRASSSPKTLVSSDVVD